MADFDLIDVFRILHGYTVQEYSWYSNNRGRYRGRRFDHVFASKSLAPTACRYLEEFRKRGLSDHSPMGVDFGGGKKEKRGGIQRKAGLASG